MASAAASSQPSLRTRAVLDDSWRIYKNLFVQTLVTGGLVFGALGLLDAALTAGPAHRMRLLLMLLAFALPVVGTSLVQGALIEAVNDEREGLEPASVGSLYRTALDKIASLVGVALLTGVGIGLGCLLLLVPGIVLAVRWSLAVPVVMLEHAAPRAAMRRSRELVRGHGWSVFRVLLNVGIITGLLSLLIRTVAIAMVGAENRSLATWVAVTFGGALATPYMSHALSVLYYRLAEPERPLMPARSGRWPSIWEGPAS